MSKKRRKAERDRQKEREREKERARKKIKRDKHNETDIETKNIYNSRKSVTCSAVPNAPTLVYVGMR